MLKPIRRAVHFDFHTMPGVEDFGEKFDAALLARQLKDAHVEYINFFGRCNIGWSYYPTEVGYPYPNLKGKNILGDVVRECHKLGISVTGYLNAGVHHEGLLRHPEWSKVNMNGQVRNLDPNMVCNGNFFRLPCYNTAYAEHLLAEIREILAQGVDGIFCDCMILRPCLCPNCTKEMLARGMDLSDEKQVTDFAEEQRANMIRRIRETVPEDKYLFFNSLPCHLTKDVATHAEIECLPAVTGYDMFFPFAAWARPMYGTVVYMNGRFQIEWADFGGYKGKAAIENDFYDALMNGATTCLGDHLHPVGLAERAVYRDLKEIYGRIKAYEPWTDGAKFSPEVAVLALSKPRQIHYGVGRILAELNYGFDILMPDGDFSGYPVLILPDEIPVDGLLAQKLDDYLKNGGKVLSTGTSGLTCDGKGFALPQWEFSYEGRDPTEISYYKTAFEDPDLADLRWECYEPGILMKGTEGSTVFAERVTTYFNPGYDGEHFYYYMPPKDGPSGYATALMNGEKNVIHVSFPLFKAYMKTFTKAHRILIKHLLTTLIPHKQILSEELPVTSRATLTKGTDYTLLHVKVTYPEIRGKLGVIEEHNVLPAGRTVGVKGAFSSASLLPDETPLPFAVKEGYTYVTLPEITGYAMILLK